MGRWLVQKTNDKGCWWHCGNCGALLNGQLGFTTEDDEWTCTECGEWNDVSDDNILYEEQEGDYVIRSITSFM